jgi:hypothetical protein
MRSGSKFETKDICDAWFLLIQMKLSLLDPGPGDAGSERVAAEGATVA